MARAGEFGEIDPEVFREFADDWLRARRSRRTPGTPSRLATVLDPVPDEH